jgi:hypothetical protein
MMMMMMMIEIDTIKMMIDSISSLATRSFTLRNSSGKEPI